MCETSSPTAPVDTDQFVQQVAERMRLAYAVVRQQLRVNFDRAKARYDHRVKERHFAVGDFVWYMSPRRRVGVGRKWQLATTGPYRVMRCINYVNYVIQRSPSGKAFIVHIDRMTLFEGDAPKCWRSWRSSDSSATQPAAEVAESAEFPTPTAYPATVPGTEAAASTAANAAETRTWAATPAAVPGTAAAADVPTAAVTVTAAGGESSVTATAAGGESADAPTAVGIGGNWNRGQRRRAKPAWQLDFDCERGKDRKKARAAGRLSTDGSSADSIAKNIYSCLRMSFVCRICQLSFTRFGPMQRHQLLQHRIWQYQSGELADWTEERLEEKVTTIRELVHARRLRQKMSRRGGRRSETSTSSAADPADPSDDDSSTPATVPPTGRCAFIRQMSPEAVVQSIRLSSDEILPASKKSSDAATVTPPLPPSSVQTAARRWSMRRAAGNFQPPSSGANAYAESDWSD